MTERRIRVRVTGVVQGVGFRPFVYARATERGITGLVGNDAGGVFVEAQGNVDALDALVSDLRTGPPMSRVDDVTVSTANLVPESGFRIVASTDDAGRTSIPPDTRVCEDCLREMRDPADRRHGYAFIACTNCGPRYTIVTGLPYDRPSTTMAAFPLCPECQSEYDDPASRRFHAQPTACPACGPQLSLGIAEIVRALNGGSIVAIKGVGGYHLACDARQPAAVERLRARKGRGAKPFALMAADLDVARSVADFDTVGGGALTSRAAPVPRRSS